MKITATTLFFEYYLFSCFIESISSQPNPGLPVHTTLEKLFPGSEGVHFPRIEKVNSDSAKSLPNFRKFNGQQMHQDRRTFLKRGDFIFGYTVEYHIKILGSLFSPRLNVYPVFDTRNYRWYTLSLGELQKLGVSRFLPFVEAHDETHDVVHQPYLQENSEAHNAACKEAFRKTMDYETTLKEPSWPEEGDVDSVKEYYKRIYNKAYRRHVGGASGSH